MTEEKKVIWKNILLNLNEEMLRGGKIDDILDKYNTYLDDKVEILTTLKS